MQPQKKERSDPLIKCPGCDLKPPECDTRGQIKHMEEFHPEIIAEFT